MKLVTVDKKLLEKFSSAVFRRPFFSAHKISADARRSLHPDNCTFIVLK
ncbi:MAG: hypothetical protein LUI13_01700 [Lachnospiraceae bacterium]|nr:hypothetical protein [Lachnospiraceae bacterium]